MKRENQNQKGTDKQRKTRVIYSDQKMKIENNWKKLKGSAAIKLKN